MTERRSGRTAVVAAQLLLALAALFSLPLGARDGSGVSSILPPLRSTVAGPVSIGHAGADRRREGSLGAVTTARRAVRRQASRPRRRPRAGHALRPRPASWLRSRPRRAPGHSRAPPLVR